MGVGRVDFGFGCDSPLEWSDCEDVVFNRLAVSVRVF